MTARRLPARAPKRPRICGAIRDARDAKALSQHELAGRLGVSQSMIGRWETVREPSLEMVAAIERALGLRAGQLLKAAGYVDGGGTSVAQAVKEDGGLDARGRRVLLAAYRSLVGRP